MLTKLIIPAIVALAFASNASALSAKGTFKKKTHKIKGSWALLEIQNKQVLAFHNKFKTKEGTELKIVLSKKTLGSLSKAPTLKDPVSLSLLRSHTGDQNYIVPSHINLEDYKSVLIHSEVDNVLWGGFDIPSKRDLEANRDSDVFNSDDRDSGSFGS